jgi:hypothetical protein
MLKSTLMTGALVLALFATAPQATETAASAAQNHANASDGFPSQEMANQFNEYLAWTKAQGLSRLVAFEPRAGAADVLPNPAMRDTFEEYLKWAVETGRGPYYAFTVRNFD